LTRYAFLVLEMMW